MKVFFYDVFKNEKSILDAPAELLEKENKHAWGATKSGAADRFFPVVFDDNELVRGAVVHLGDVKTYEEAEQEVARTPWLVHGFSDGFFCIYENFTSIELLFNQKRKYAYDQQKPLLRLQAFSTDPTVTWYVVVLAKNVSTYDAEHGVGDAVGCFRLLKGGIADEVFDISHEKKGKILRLKCNNRAEAAQYAQELSSIRSQASELTLLKTKSTSVWDFTFF